MAFIRNQYCRFCEAEKQHTNGKCNDCREREHREAMAAWQAKTTDEKLLDIHKRLQRLEAGPSRYFLSTNQAHNALVKESNNIR